MCQAPIVSQLWIVNEDFTGACPLKSAEDEGTPAGNGGGSKVDGERRGPPGGGAEAPRRYSPNQTVSSGRMKNGREPGSGVPSTSP